MSDKYTKLAKNTAIFAIGSFGSKLLTFLIVPLYTYVLTIEEYGRIDLFTTTVGLLIPFVTLSIQEALMRFLLGKEITDETAVNNCFFIFVCGVFLSFLVYPIYKFVFGSDRYFFLFLGYLIISSYTNIFSQYLRASGDVIAYTINGVLVTIITLFSNLYFLLYLRLGMVGYLYSLILAQLISAIYITIKSGILSALSIRKIDFSMLKKMLEYCIPLIPNGLMWWLMSGGDKYIINYALGDSANGLYSLAMKIPTIINMVYLLFYQAWQMAAIEENKNKGEKQFYETMFRMSTALLVFLTSAITLCVKPVYLFAMSENFQDAWYYVPGLSLATIFSCYSSFFGVIYAVKKQTKRAFCTTLIGAVVNLVVNYIMIFYIGLHGVTVGTFMGYIVVATIRAKDTYQENHMNFEFGQLVLIYVILILQIVVTVSWESTMIYVINGICLIVLLIIFRQEIEQIWSVFRKKLGLKRREHSESSLH